MNKFAKFTEMVNGTAEDYVPIVEASMQHNTDLPKRILEHLEMLKGDHGGFAVDRIHIVYKTATRAYRDGRDDEYVVCALLHDIGDILAPANHADFAATLLEPYISEKIFGYSNITEYFKDTTFFIF